MICTPQRFRKTEMAEKQNLSGRVSVGLIKHMDGRSGKGKDAEGMGGAEISTCNVCAVHLY